MTDRYQYLGSHDPGKHIQGEVLGQQVGSTTVDNFLSALRAIEELKILSPPAGEQLHAQLKGTGARGKWLGHYSASHVDAIREWGMEYLLWRLEPEGPLEPPPEPLGSGSV